LLSSLAACSDPRAAAKREIQAWGDAWRAARACSLGENPLADDPKDAIALRALLEPNSFADLEECKIDVKLTRRHATHSESTAIEAAWDDLEKAINSVRNLTPDTFTGMAGEARTRAALHSMGRRIAAVDRAYHRLRERAGMPPDSLPVGPAIEAPAGVVVAGPDGAQVHPRTLELHDNSLTVEGRKAIAIVRDPQRIEVMPKVRGGVPAASSTHWGVWTERANQAVGEPVLVAAGPLDASGKPGDGAVIVARGREMTPLFALGDGRKRVVLLRVAELYTPQGEEPGMVAVLVILASKDGGATWDEALVAGRDGSGFATLDWAHRRFGLAWSEGKEVYSVRLDGDSLPDEIEKSHFGSPREPPVPCFGATRTWWVSAGELHVQKKVRGEPEEVPGYAHANGTIQCADEGLVSIDGTLLLCHVDGCGEIGTADSRDSRLMVALGPRTGFSAVADQMGYIVFARPMERDDGLQLAFRAPPGGVLQGTAEWNGTLYGVFQFQDAVRLIPLPLR
jgi:hypothetical protein